MTFNGDACIRYLLDNALELKERIAAAESLAYYPQQSACEALLATIMDTTQDPLLRELAASSLGTLWAKIGYDRDALFRLPDPYFREVVSEMLPLIE